MYGIKTAVIIKSKERGNPLKVIICRASAYHVPQPNRGASGVDFCCITELLKQNFLEDAFKSGVFYHIDTRRVLDEHERIKISIDYNYNGVIYECGGTVDEFLVRFSAIDMMEASVKRCQYCSDCFVSPPSEWYRHMLKHIADGKELFRRKSFSYYFGPE